MKTAIYAGIIWLTLSGCTLTASMEDGPDRDTPPPTGSYVVGVTHLRLKGEDGASDSFSGHAETLQALVKAAPGNVGTTYRNRLFGRDVWTMSIWTDPVSMGQFVASKEHLAAIHDVMPFAEEARTVRFTIPQDAYPPSWDDALQRLEEEGVDR